MYFCHKCSVKVCIAAVSCAIQVETSDCYDFCRKILGRTLLNISLQAVQHYVCWSLRHDSDRGRSMHVASKCLVAITDKIRMRPSTSNTINWYFNYYQDEMTQHYSNSCSKPLISKIGTKSRCYLSIIINSQPFFSCRNDKCVLEQT